MNPAVDTYGTRRLTIRPNGRVLEVTGLCNRLQRLTLLKC